MILIQLTPSEAVQLQPSGEVTLIEPVPPLDVKESLGGEMEYVHPGGVLNKKVAITVWAWFIVTVQSPVPLQPPPLQPTKVESSNGSAVNVTSVPNS